MEPESGKKKKASGGQLERQCDWRKVLFLPSRCCPTGLLAISEPHDEQIGEF